MFDAVKQAWVAWAALIAFALTSFCPAVGLVVCISDGHVAIELATPGDDCADCESTASTSNCCSESAPAACECYDISLLSGSQPIAKPAPSQAGVVSIPEPCLFATLDLELPRPPSNHFGTGSGALPPPCPRVPTLLTLRI